MKKKTINSIICKKFNEFLESITDEKVKKLVEENSIITGGCIASMLLNETVSDFDIYFSNKETVKAVAKYYVKQWNDAHGDSGYVLDGANLDSEFAGGVALNMTPDRIKIVFESRGVVKEAGAVDDESDIEEYVETEPKETKEDKPKYRPVYLSCNAITLSNKIQIVIRFYGDAQTIHQNYDYVHCTNYWTSKNKELVLNQPALEALLAKELKYIGSKYPIASLIRTRKFIKRGWTINAGQYLKMAFQISQLDLSNIETLEDQLVGVDVAYFNILIDALQKHTDKEKQENREFVLNYGYLATIIDKLF